MDMKEASAMTEASGLTNEEDGNARRLAPQSPSQNAAIRWAERLRRVTVKAPLQSLFVAFLLGIWVARRRYENPRATIHGQEAQDVPKASTISRLPRPR